MHCFVRRAAAAIAVAAIITSSWMVATPRAADAATVAYQWRAEVGAPPSNVATLALYAGGRGALRFSATRTDLAAGTTYSVAIHRGVCPWRGGVLGATLAEPGTVKAGGGGSVSRTLVVQLAAMKKIRSAWSGGSGLVLMMTGNHIRWCYPLSALGRLGAAVSIPGDRSFLATRAERWAGSGRSIPGSGKCYVTVYVRIAAGKSAHYARDMFVLETPDGAYHAAVALDRRQPAIPEGPVAAGASVEGWETVILPDREADALVLMLFDEHWLDVVVGRGPAVAVPLGPLASQGPDRPVPSPSPTPTPTPSLAPTPTPTATPGPTPSPTPVSTPAP